MSAEARIPLPRDQIVLFEEPSFSAEACRGLLRFYEWFHERNLLYFLSLRARWMSSHPGRRFPGLCANVHPLTGCLRPDSEQRLWGWGDGRALATWCSFLAAGRVPDGSRKLESGTPVELREAIAGYADILWQGMHERYRLNGGMIPFTADPETNRADDRTAGRPTAGADFTSLFAAGGFLQYGLWRGDEEALALGKRLLEEQIGEIGLQPPLSHGPRMILTGVIVDALKTIEALGDEKRDLGARLRATALAAVDEILSFHYREEDGGVFWEASDEAGRPVVGEDGAVVVDPGHTTELAGFMAELARFLPAEPRRRLIAAALRIHLFADRVGFTAAGAMSKYVDLGTGRLLPDTQAAAASGAPARPTAPWWNVREHSAAALRLYTLTADPRLVESYRRGQHASYLLYPNQRIGGQMIQTIDPLTLEPLDLAPATGNLDPMHDPRSRMREIECLEQLLAASGVGPT